MPATPQFPIQELEQIESAIQASQRWIATLQVRRALLTAKLDRLTRPQPVPISAPLAGVNYRGGG